MKVLVTGAAGFIGSHLVDALLLRGFHVVGIDDLSRGKLSNLESAFTNPLFIFYKLDIRTELALLYSQESNYDCVVHLASIVGSINLYNSNPFSVLSDNIKIDTSILDYSVHKRIPHFIYASSGHVYPAELTSTHQELPASEEQAFPANPSLTYGWAKLLGEILCNSANRQFDSLSSTALRLVGIYGPRQDDDPKTASLIPALCARAINHPIQPFTLQTNGTETRSYLYISDAIDAIIMLVESRPKPPRHCCYNLGSGTSFSVKEIAKFVIETSEKVIAIDFTWATKPKVLSQSFSSASFSIDFGWYPNVLLKDGIKLTYESISRRLLK